MGEAQGMARVGKVRLHPFSSSFAMCAAKRAKRKCNFRSAERMECHVPIILINLGISKSKDLVIPLRVIDVRALTFLSEIRCTVTGRELC